MDTKSLIMECLRLLASHKLTITGYRYQRSAMLQDISDLNNRIEQLDEDYKKAPASVTRLEKELERLKAIQRSGGSVAATPTEKKLEAMQKLLKALPPELVQEMIDSAKEAST